MATVNNIRLLGEEFNKIKIVEKVTTLLEKYESKISSLEDSRDLSTISLLEFIKALYAQEQRRINILEEHSEGAFQAKSNDGSSLSYKGKKPWSKKKERPKIDAGKKFPPCVHCQSQAVDDNQVQEEHVFSASCFATSSKVKKDWLDNSCTHHMASDERMFREINTSFVSKVKIGNVKFSEARGKEDFIMNTLLDLVESMSKVDDKGAICEASCLSDSRYFVLLIDDCTRFCWVHFLKQKSKVVDFFWKFKAMVENQASYKLKILSTKKGYKVFDPSTKKIIVKEDLQPAEDEVQSDEGFDDTPIRGTRPIIDIYKKCGLASLEPSSFDEVAKYVYWKEDMKAYINMIHEMIHRNWLIDQSIKGRKEFIDEFKKQMQVVFEMSDLGEMTYFLGIEVIQTQHAIFISQQAFALNILRKFCMENCKPASIPVAQGEKLSSKGDYEKVDEKGYKSLVDCLLYLTASRLDIMFAVSLLSRFMHCYNVAHFKVAKRVLRYVKGTLSYRVKFKQQTMAQSTAEVEYIAVVATVNQAIAIWLRKLLSDLNLSQGEATEIKIDN
ncbi:laccase-2-like [Gossypium australe]|uniref:Laccase-2-like n=1 Tax=Gossypium australe TaxID=47621 RepID=A0A5B6X2L9_9ROSI|nr:laccase-2-like [Gossypium australe]